MLQPAAIDGLAFARNAALLEGRLDLDSMPRLAQSGCSGAVLGFVLAGEISQRGKPALGLTVEGMVRLECQRCLESLEFPLRLVAQLELATNEAEIAAGDGEDDIDRVLARPDMGVAELVEDEVLLALPMVPKHAQCKAAAGSEGNVRPSVFAGLAALKKSNR